MAFKITAYVALILALLTGAIYWFVTRPTSEEKALTAFFREFKMGHYDEAEELTTGKNFYAMAAATSVRDSDGSEYLIGDYFPENRSGILRFSIETYVRRHVVRWKYLSMETERFEGDENYAIVHFRIEVAIRDYTTGELLGAVLHEGRIEGIAHMDRENDRWVVRNFEFSIFSEEDLKLSSYLDMAY
jgi:hypothetical protein